MSAIEVVAVNNNKSLNDFIKAATVEESQNPQWVEQLHDEAHQIFSPKSPFLKENAIQPFVAYKQNAPVGRIVATVDTSHQAKYGDDCGFFGFLEGIPDREVFKGLFDAAEDFLRSRRMKKARGPFGLNVNGETGLLVDGFDQRHITQTNHCPPYYSEYIEALGYEKAIDLYALTCKLSESRLPERVARDSERIGAPAIEIRNAKYTSFFRDLATVISFYNDAWSENQYSLPIGKEEENFIGKLMMPIVNPKWIYFAYHQGELVSIIVQIPDVNEALAGLRGRLMPFGLPKLLWRIHVRGVRSARVMLAATAKKWRDTIVGMAAMGQIMARSIEDARNAGIEEVEYSWILENNRAAIDPVLRLPSKRTRTFRIYEKLL